MLNFEFVFFETIKNAEFLREYDRLRGTSFSLPGSLIHQIDVATGKHDEDIQGLIDFIFTAIWIPYIRDEACRTHDTSIPPSTRTEKRARKPANTGSSTCSVKRRAPEKQ